MKIAISAESTVDLNNELIEKFGVKIVPYTVLLGDTAYLDGEITVDQIISYVDKNKILPKTSAVNEYQFEEHFNSLLKDYDAVIHFSLSSEMSSSYKNAENVAKRLGNVYVVDSRSLSTGIALLIIYAYKLIEKGEDVKTVYEKVLKRVPFVQASFALKRLDYLYKGGRCNALVYFGANLLKIRPQILVKDGKMISGKKYRGNFEHVVENYCKDTLEEFSNPDLENVFITYTTADDATVEVAKAAVKNAGFKNIYVTRARATITSHCGENTLGILYINDGGKD